jgi:ABC-type antimicrobial peptide transport system permease subunit
VATQSWYFAGITVVISCLGLIGLTAFTAQRRRKEIGMRKVIGASARNIAIMLSREFLHIVFIALIIAFPIVWWMGSLWLNGLAYRAQLTASTFLFAGCSICLSPANGVLPGGQSFPRQSGQIPKNRIASDDNMRGPNASNCRSAESHRT